LNKFFNLKYAAVQTNIHITNNKQLKFAIKMAKTMDPTLEPGSISKGTKAYDWSNDKYSQLYYGEAIDIYNWLLKIACTKLDKKEYIKNRNSDD